MDFTGYSITQVAKMYGEKNSKYVRDLITGGKIPGYKYKGAWYIKDKDIHAAGKIVMNKKRSITRWC